MILMNHSFIFHVLLNVVVNIPSSLHSPLMSMPFNICTYLNIPSHDYTGGFYISFSAESAVEQCWCR